MEYEQINKEIGERIRSRRKALGLTQVELAEMVGYTRVSITRIEKGDRCIAYEKLSPICEALKVTPEWLLLGKEAKTPPPMDGEVMRLFTQLSERDKQKAADYIGLLHLASRGDNK
jgi:transcriptional regulator with XRE-family HTH domain